MIIPTFPGRAIVSPKVTTKNEIVVWEPKNILSTVLLLAISKLPHWEGNPRKREVYGGVGLRIMGVEEE